MKNGITRVVSAIAMLLILAISTLMPQPAYSQAYYYAQPRRPSVYQTHPILSRTVTGGAIGAATGAIIGAVTRHHRAGKGALIGGGIGAGLGLGYGLLRDHQYRTRGWF